MFNNSSELLSAVMEETGGLGVDIVVDSGGKKLKLLFLTSSHIFEVSTLFGCPITQNFSFADVYSHSTRHL